MRRMIRDGLQVQAQWDALWKADSIERNQGKLDYPEYWPIYEKYISKQAEILEAGVGLGKWLNYFSKGGYRIVGIDYSESAIQKLKQYDSSLHVELGDVTAIPFEDSSFDVYLSYGVLEHLEEHTALEQAINEMYRVLRPGGVAFITIPNLNIMNYFYALANAIKFNNWMRRLFLKPIVNGHFFEYNYTPAEFLSFFRSDQFEVCEVVPENIPLILKRFDIFLDKGQVDEGFGTRLNQRGNKIWGWLLKRPPTSFLRCQLSHLCIYVLKKRK